jgi:pyruvate/oxaloacetate carboxyltransferase
MLLIINILQITNRHKKTRFPKGKRVRTHYENTLKTYQEFKLNTPVLVFPFPGGVLTNIANCLSPYKGKKGYFRKNPETPNFQPNDHAQEY